MNEDVSKSFQCKEHNCDSGFYSEQSLTSHQQSKHSKLNLEIPSKVFPDNQTPTPTKFLNKCEELRVFDDPYIQNLNPFDEGFRQAISSDNNRRETFLTTQQSQDTLHTPQIIPEFLSQPKATQKLQDEPENLSLTPENIPKITLSEVEAHKLVPLLPKPSVIYAATSTSFDPSNVKNKLKSVILGNSTEIKREKINLPAILIATPANFIINNGASEVQVGKLKKDLKRVRVESESEREGSGKRKADASKVERNRAAARRYRNKMKAQGQQLRDKCEKANKEVGQLKKEIVELKKLLLLHKDCDVTKRLAS